MSYFKREEKLEKKKNQSACHKASTYFLGNHQIRKILLYLYLNRTVAPIDKANGNMAIICKRFYKIFYNNKSINALTLMKELGVTIGNRNNNKTCKMINTTNENDIVDKQTAFLNRYRLCENKANKCLPHIYWFPKLNKNLTKLRFVEVALNCSLPLSKYMTAVFKILFSHDIFQGSTLFR